MDLPNFLFIFFFFSKKVSKDHLVRREREREKFYYRLSPCLHLAVERESENEEKKMI